MDTLLHDRDFLYSSTKRSSGMACLKGQAVMNCVVCCETRHLPIEPLVPPERYHQNLHICGTRFRRTPRLAVLGHKTFHIPDIGLHGRSLALYSAKAPSRENCLVCPVGGIDIHRSKAQNTGAHVNLRRANIGGHACANRANHVQT